MPTNPEKFAPIFEEKISEETETDGEISETKYKLEEVSYSERQEKEPGRISFINRGFLDVSLDNKAISQVLSENGFSPEQISDLTVIFRPSFYEDRDFHGGVIGGLVDGKTTEVYTSLSIDASRTIQEHIPIREEQLINGLFHELMHQIQRARGETLSNTFAARNQEEHDQDLQEREAIQFAKKMEEEMKGVLKIKHALPKNVTKDPERKTGILDPNIDKYYDTGEKIHIANTDHPAIYFFERIDKFSASRDTNSILKELEKGQELVKNRKLGIFEYNALLKKLEAEELIEIKEKK